MLEYFTDLEFFSNPLEEVSLYNRSVINNKGMLETTKVFNKLLQARVIMPISNQTLNNRIIEKGAVLHTKEDINFFDTSNTSDLILWKGSFYRIAEKIQRNEYEYKYILEFTGVDNE